MKRVDTIKQKILNLKEYILKNYKADIIGLFGSFTKHSSKKYNDIDILVKFKKNATLFDFIELSNFLEERLNIKTDIVPFETLRKEIKDDILKHLLFL